MGEKLEDHPTPNPPNRPRRWKGRNPCERSLVQPRISQVMAVGYMGMMKRHKISWARGLSNISTIFSTKPNFSFQRFQYVSVEIWRISGEWRQFLVHFFDMFFSSCFPKFIRCVAEVKACETCPWRFAGWLVRGEGSPLTRSECKLFLNGRYQDPLNIFE